MFDLGHVGLYRLQRPPLAQALAQVRFPLVAKLQTFEGVSPLQDALQDEYPYMDKVVETGMAISIGQPAAALQTETTNSWHFKDDEDRLIVLSPNSLTLSVGKQYEGFNEFRDRFDRVLDILKQTFSIRRCVQVGTRYVNIIDDTGAEIDHWKTIFETDLVGWPASEIVHGDTRLQASVSQIQLVSPPTNALADFPADVQAVIRHGIAPENSIVPGIPPIQLPNRAFFLDIDMFIAANQEFHTSEITGQLRTMHSQIAKFFHWSLTDEGKNHFSLKEG
jgi:uncharacterized protein (TIGR04255 family)